MQSLKMTSISKGNNCHLNLKQMRRTNKMGKALQRREMLSLGMGTSRQSPIGYSKRIQTSRINSSTVRYTEMMRQPISKINRRKSSYLHRARTNHPRMPQRKISTVPLERLPTRQTSKIRSRRSSNPMAQQREKVEESTSSRITIPGSFFFRVGKQSLLDYQIQTAQELSM